MSDTSDFKRQLWRDVLMEGIGGVARGMRAGLNDCVLMADEMVKRYAARFEPGEDLAPLLAEMAADAERIEQEREEAKRKQAQAAIQQHRENGPWAPGTPMRVKSTGEMVTVRQDDGGAIVQIKRGLKNSTIDRGLLAWPEAEETKDLPVASIAPVGLQ
jgi:hypothetical protein